MWLPGAMGKVIILKRYSKKFITHKSVDNLILFLVFFNTLILSLDGLLDSRYDDNVD